MEPLNLQLYYLALAKLHLKDSEAKEFVSTIHKMVEESNQNLATKEFVSNELSETKFDILKWIFLFWVGQLSATIVIVIVLIKY
jgi:hypothetical protein